MISALMLSQVFQMSAGWGLVAATTAAFFWSISVVLYRRVGRVMPPVLLNMTKGMVAVVLLSGVLLVDRFVLGREQWDISTPMLLLMALSGVVGIGLGDSLFFAGLNRMGARRMLLLFTLNPVITVLVAWALLGEGLTLLQVLGVGLTCGGVAWVIAERNTSRSDGHVDGLGLIFGLSAAACQAAGVLLSRYVFEQGQMTAASSAWLRLAAGSLVLVLLLPVDRLLKDPGGQAHHHPRLPSKMQAWVMFAVALMLGTVGGIWLMQVAVKESERVGVASTLLSTSPLFILPIVAMLGEHISMRAVFGALVTIAGVGMLFVF